jgi:hypothetical protein
MYRLHAGVYEPSKPSSWSPIGAWLTSTTSLIGSGEKLGMDTWAVSRRAVDCVGSPFSQEQWDPSKFVGVSQMVAICGPHEICMVLYHMWTERGKCVACWSGFPLQGVHQFESL